MTFNELYIENSDKGSKNFYWCYCYQIDKMKTLVETRLLRRNHEEIFSFNIGICHANWQRTGSLGAIEGG